MERDTIGRSRDIDPGGPGSDVRRSRASSDLLRRIVLDESGATAIEYGLIIAGLAALLIGALSLMGTSLTGRFSAVASTLAK